MKTQKVYSTMLFVVALLLSGSMASAQDKESEQRKKQEIQAAQEAELRQKKLMLEEQQQQMKEKQIQFEDQQRKMREMEREFAEQSRITGRGDRELLRSSGVYTPGPFGAPLLPQANQSQLTLRNSFQGGSDSSKGEFNVEPGSYQFRCMISGKVISGEIYINVEYPGGKVFKELTITSAAEITFSQSVTIKEGEEDKYIGAWHYKIVADKAEGSYMLQITTN